MASTLIRDYPIDDDLKVQLAPCRRLMFDRFVLGRNSKNSDLLCQTVERNAHFVLIGAGSSVTTANRARRIRNSNRFENDCFILGESIARS